METRSNADLYSAFKGASRTITPSLGIAEYLTDAVVSFANGVTDAAGRIAEEAPRSYEVGKDVGIATSLTTGQKRLEAIAARAGVPFNDLLTQIATAKGITLA